MSNLLQNELRWLNSQTNVATTTLSTLLRSVEILWVWVNMCLSQMILKRSCTIFFRKSLSIRAQTCHEVLLLPVNRMAGEAMCLTKQRKMEHQIKHTLIYLKLSYEVADAPITWITLWPASAEDWKLSGAWISWGPRVLLLRDLSFVLFQFPLLPKSITQSFFNQSSPIWLKGTFKLNNSKI
jgi:hypothetical protein